MLSKEPRLSAEELLKTPEVIGWQNLLSDSIILINFYFILEITKITNIFYRTIEQGIVCSKKS